MKGRESRVRAGRVLANVCEVRVERHQQPPFRLRGRPTSGAEALDISSTSSAAVRPSERLSSTTAPITRGPRMQVSVFYRRISFVYEAVDAGHCGGRLGERCVTTKRKRGKLRRSGLSAFLEGICALRGESRGPKWRVMILRLCYVVKNHMLGKPGVKFDVEIKK